MLLTILLVIVVIALLGGFYPWSGPNVPPGQPAAPPRYYHGYGFGMPFGALGVVIIIVLLLAVFGRL